MKSQERIFSRQNFTGLYLENKHGDLYIFFDLWFPLLIPYLYKLVFWNVNYFETEKPTPLSKGESKCTKLRDTPTHQGYFFR